MSVVRLDEAFVYFIRPIGMHGPVKIGVSGNIPHRIRRLNAASPFPLELAVAIPGDENLEVKIHNCLVPHHSHAEWFLPTPEVVNLIDQLKRGVAIEQLLDFTAERVSLRSLRNKVASFKRVDRHKRDAGIRPAIAPEKVA